MFVTLKKGSSMKLCLFALTVMIATQVFAADSILNTSDNTKSVLTNQEPAAAGTPKQQESTTATQEPTKATRSCKCSAPGLSYKGKQNVSPCSVEKGACLSFCEKATDACCNTTFQRVTVEVPICVPACPTKESVSRSRDGKRAVYDYGKYEVVLKANNDGDVSVRYRKRLLDR